MIKESAQNKRVYGTLHVASTPIGNLKDITLRALEILKEADLIAAEGARHTKALCRHYGIETHIVSYNQHNHMAKSPGLIKRLKSGSDIVLVTNAGTPGVSDPGGQLVRKAQEENIRVSPISGSSAVTSALSVSGLNADKFLFLGFLPNKEGKRRKALKELVSTPYTLVFFEAPHRISAMLKDFMEILGDRHMVMLREMTKIYEEVVSGQVSSVQKHLKKGRVKGEITLVVSGDDKKRNKAELSKEALEKMEKALKTGKLSVKDLARKFSEEEGISFRKVYKKCLSLKERVVDN